MRDAKPSDGGPPFGFERILRIFVDPDLLEYDEVWATPRHVERQLWFEPG